MVIGGFLPYSLLFVRKFCCFLVVVVRFAARMLRMVIPRVSVLFSAVCLKGSLVFVGSCKVGF